MKISNKVLMEYGYYLIILEFEPAINDVFEKGVIKEWVKQWLNNIPEDIIRRATGKAMKNGWPSDFEKFENFRRVLDFSDSSKLMQSFEKNNNFFKKFFSDKTSKMTLDQSLKAMYNVRCLLGHNPDGADCRKIYVDDIKKFLDNAVVVCDILNITHLSLKYEKLKNNLEDDIMNSKYYEENFQLVTDNLPVPDYDDWFGLVGRDSIKKDIISDFQRGNNRVIAITGGGGVGKSALALEICREFLHQSNWTFNHIIWITSKNNFLDYSGILTIKPEFYYQNNYKDFLNQFNSGFYGGLYIDNLDDYSEEELEKDANQILMENSRILFVIDNLENINDPKILEFIKERITPPNYVLITSRKGLGEINKIYKLEALDNDSALMLFKNICRYFNIEIKNLGDKTLREYTLKTQNYPLVIKWCLSLVANKKMPMDSAFQQLSDPKNNLLEFLFPTIYKELSKNSKTILQILVIYREKPDRNIVAYIADIDNEDEFSDAIFELEQFSLIKQDRVPTKNEFVIIETLEFLGLTEKFIQNILNSAGSISKKEKIENRILSIEKEIEQIDEIDNNDCTYAQKLAQSKLLKALKMRTLLGVPSTKEVSALIVEAERLAPRFHLTPFYKALIATAEKSYNFRNIRKLLQESINLYPYEPKVHAELGRLIKINVPESKEYPKHYSTAFNLEMTCIGYGISAAEGFMDFGDEDEALKIVNLIRDKHDRFPQGDNSMFLHIRTTLHQIEIDLTQNINNCCSLLNEIQEYIEILGATKNREYRLSRALFYSIYAFVEAIKSNNKNAFEYKLISLTIIEQYKGNTTDRNSYQLQKIICYNLLVEYLINGKQSDKIAKLTNEMNGENKQKLNAKFKTLINYVTK